MLSLLDSVLGQGWLKFPTESLNGPTLACCGPIPDDRTFTPGQWVLEGFEEVEDTPSNDHIIIQPDKEADLRTKAQGEVTEAAGNAIPPCTPTKAQQHRPTTRAQLHSTEGGRWEMR